MNSPHSDVGRVGSTGAGSNETAQNLDVSQSGASNTQEARRLAEEVVKRDDTKLTEALLADAIGHLAAEIEAIRSRVETLQRRVNGNLPDPAAWVR